MRAALMTLSLVPALLMGMPAAGQEAASSVAKKAPAEDKAAATAQAPEEEKEFTPPPGWHRKMRGKFIVYCRKQPQMGSRVPVDVCYDEDGIRAMLQSQREDRERVDQMRRVCSSQATCGVN